MNRAFSKIWVLIIFIILVGGGFFAWQYFGAPEEITNWKTYKNEYVGFEVKYPQNLKEEWKLPEESFALHESWGKQIGKRLLLFLMADSEKIYGFGFSVYSNPNNLTLGEFSQKLMDWMKLGCQLKITEDVSLGDKQTPGVKFIFDNCNSARAQDEIINQVLIKEDNNIIEISGIGSSSNSEFIENFSKIISTFEFNKPEETIGNYIKILSPDGGEEWEEGKTHTIKWQSSGVNKVNIEYGDGKSWHIELGYPAEIGEYSWTPKEVISQYEGFTGKDLTEINVKIGIWDAENANIFDKSDNSFILIEEGKTADQDIYRN